jgi:hypothetical protein
MKRFIFTLLALVGAPFAQIMTIGGQTSWGDTARWGDTDDSASYIRQRGNATALDSSGTWRTITTDSCSKWVRTERGAQRPVQKTGEIQYEVRSSSGQTDSTQVLFGFDTRYCNDPVRSRECGPIVRYGRHEGTAMYTPTDSIYSKATVNGVTWLGTSQEFELRHGNQVRVCVDGYKAGGAAGDTLYFRNVILRFQ